MSSVNFEPFFQRLEAEGSLVNEMCSLGWAFWPSESTGGGYMDEYSLRALADEIERRNKPFWDEYDKYCLNNPPIEDVNFDEPFEVDVRAL